MRQKIPHLVTFDSGQSILITMAGKPPLCLKCRCVGHVRKDCTSRRSWSQVMRGGYDGDGTLSHDDPVSPVAAEVPVGTSVAPSGLTDASPPPSSGAENSAARVAVPGGQGSSQAADNSEVIDA